MSKVQIYGPALIVLAAVVYKLHQAHPHPVQEHRNHNQESQTHDVLTVLDGLRIIKEDWRDLVPHTHH